ncbi:MAG: hypothetical protein IKW96_07405 [Ruminococcus sp.]|uniref:hypothetical protein n=1 Tax=Ruminococcus sp. TaxID=41978 RepID=UPI0025E20560|nr:hypothetical protein [Ruminococcus sp.]MBR5683091.1 hypothetical protein [Ruminococcus sp.]
MNELQNETKDIKESNVLKRLKNMFSKLSTAKKVQAIIASVFTLILMIALPVYAWFALGGKLEAFTKIEEPNNLDIRAGHYDAVQYFSLNDIDIESIQSGTPHRVVFSVSAGDYKIPYQIQLAHTTNIPFIYKIYRAKEHTSVQGGQYVTYISEPLKVQGESTYTFYYTLENQIPLTSKNSDQNSRSNYGRQIALGSGSYYNDTYDYDDDPEIYAVPIYEQSGRITYDSTSDHDYYILEISFDETAAEKEGFSEWNTADNKKETDMIYLTASRWSGN